MGEPMSATASTQATTGVRATGTSSIDALLSGTKWGGAAGTGTSLTFSFPYFGGTAAAFAPGNKESAGIAAGFSAVQAAAARATLQAWADVANISFTEISETGNGSTVGDLRFAVSNASFAAGEWGHANYPSQNPAGGDVWLNSASQNVQQTAASDWAAGSVNSVALMHEVGHALGLKHPGNYGGGTPPFLAAGLDSVLYTVMSYNAIANNMFRRVNLEGSTPQFSYSYPSAATPMVLDVQAIQALYGANTATRAGDDSYSFDTRTPFFKTLWDGGGNDTISVANFSLGCTIDLTPGSYSDIRMLSDPMPARYSSSEPTYIGKQNLGIAFGAVIENAVGGSGDDQLTGNSVANRLVGNQGRDRLTGAGGDDALDGGAGLDTATFSGAFSGYTVAAGGAGAVVTDRQAGRDGRDSLAGVERLQFADVRVAVDVDGNGGQAFRLYQAAFNRTPDAGGLGFQMNALDQGEALAQVAANFIASPEFTATYGALDDTKFVTQLYANVLHRAPDAGGLGFHTGNLASGANTRANVLVGFSESPENQAALIGTIQNGMVYTV